MTRQDKRRRDMPVPDHIAEQEHVSLKRSKVIIQPEWGFDVHS